MELRDYPETFDTGKTALKKTLKQYWLSIVASLMCFGSTGVNIGNTIRYLRKEKHQQVLLL